MSYQSEQASYLGENAQIQEQIKDVSQRTKNLERMAAKLGTKAETDDLRSRLKKEREACTKVIKQLIGSVKEPREDKQLSERQDRQFDQVFKKYQEICKKLEDKERELVTAIESQDEEDGSTGRKGGRSSPHYQQQQSTKHVDSHELQIGRAVQQECRDRSRMPSSA
eukprot:TRINITY_DN22237_c0_g1_i1.p1 TRINITY_DN22237_c0_g1~~TRINITY_DN22237_c0_g1_i1.p1  ORF type:complete len:167 (+),score=37.44 TRINITY_DN22237_c0_g1_i1:53-553(+)